METLKNFFTGLFIVILSLIILGVTFLIWPFLVGIGSLLLSILAAIIFIVLIFYIIVLIGYFVRQLMKKQ